MINFFFSFKELGGVPSLFFNLASELQQKDIPFRLICYNKSAIHKLFATLEKPFFFIDYNELSSKKIKNLLNADDILIITWWEPKLPLFKIVNPKILFWNVYPDTLLYSNQVRGKIILHYRNQQLIKGMLKKNGLIFMDDSPADWLVQYSGIKIDTEFFVPIPIMIYDFLYSRIFKPENDTLRVSYIARAEIWKLYSLLKIIDDISKSKIKSKISLTVITDNIQKVKSFLSVNENSEKSMECNFYENIPTENLHEFLLKNSDINIGMGVSCLDSAKVGIPTLLIDPSKHSIKQNYRYKWIYETEGYNLGRFYNQDKRYSGYTLNEIINNIVESKDYLNNEALKCYQYANRFHNSKVIINKFLDKVFKSEVRISDILKNNYRYSTVYKWKNFIKIIVKKINAVKK